MTQSLNNTSLNTLPDEESLDDEESTSEGEICPVCQGEGISYQVDDNDEEDRDFKQCNHCGGSGIDPNSQEEDDLTLDED